MIGLILLSSTMVCRLWQALNLALLMPGFLCHLNCDTVLAQLPANRITLGVVNSITTAEKRKRGQAEKGAGLTN